MALAPAAARSSTHIATTSCPRPSTMLRALAISTFVPTPSVVIMSTGYTDPVLMMTTDGVGTKVEIARALNMVEGLGHDVVAMCVDDLAAAGAKAIGFTDY